MANVINRDTLQFLTSQNTPDFPDPPWKINPDMTQVVGVPSYHQKWDVGADRPIPMTAGEIAAFDAAALDADADAALGPLAGANIVDVTRALALVLLDENNLLRDQCNTLRDGIVFFHPGAAGSIPVMPARDKTQIIGALKGKMV